MKIKINLFDEVLLTTVFERGEPGTLKFTKAIVDFLGRPFNPHLTLFAAEVLEPHITTADRADCLWLPTAKAAEVGRALSRVSDDLVREWVKGIRPVTLQELEAQGWGVHAPDGRAVREWVRLALRRNRGELRVDVDTLVTLARHLIRKLYLPTSLEAVLPSVHLYRPLAMRWNRHTRRPDVRALFYFPDGCGAPDDTGQPILTHPPGLYWRGFDTKHQQQLNEETFARVLPRELMVDVFRRVETRLNHYPRDKPFNDDDFAAGVPRWAWHIFGYYADAIFNIALALKAEHLDSRAPRQPPQLRPGVPNAGPRRRRRGGRD